MWQATFSNELRGRGMLDLNNLLTCPLEEEEEGVMASARTLIEAQSALPKEEA